MTRRCRIFCGETASRCVLPLNHDGPCCWTWEDVVLRDTMKAMFDVLKSDVVFARVLERERNGKA